VHLVGSADYAAAGRSERQRERRRKRRTRGVDGDGKSSDGGRS
jgi:hypothetical protein